MLLITLERFFITLYQISHIFSVVIFVCSHKSFTDLINVLNNCQSPPLKSLSLNVTFGNRVGQHCSISFFWTSVWRGQLMGGTNLISVNLLAQMKGCVRVRVLKTICIAKNAALFTNWTRPVLDWQQTAQ